MKVVANDDVAYMFGGMVIDAEGAMALSNKVFRSTDGVNWREVEVPSTYAGAYMPAVVLRDNATYVFGGVDGYTGSYGAPTTNLMTSTWVKLMN